MGTAFGESHMQGGVKKVQERVLNEDVCASHGRVKRRVLEDRDSLGKHRIDRGIGWAVCLLDEENITLREESNDVVKYLIPSRPEGL